MTTEKKQKITSTTLEVRGRKNKVKAWSFHGSPVSWSLLHPSVHCSFKVMFRQGRVMWLVIIMEQKFRSMRLNSTARLQHIMEQNKLIEFHGYSNLSLKIRLNSFLILLIRVSSKYVKRVCTDGCDYMSELY